VSASDRGPAARAWADVKLWFKEIFGPARGAGVVERRLVEVENAQPIGATADRAVARVAGVVRSIAIGPRGPSAVFEAELFDGTGVLTVIWLGQRQILGLEPGRTLICEGRVAIEDGERVMRDPRYEIVPVGTAR
jgi:hypothetical protein